jgi:histidyl-tRNA synthetase
MSSQTTSQKKIQAPKGTLDLLPADTARWQTVERIAREVAARFNYFELRTPIFEHAELFHRAAGETTDIVRKETYDFQDRGDPPRKLTLRPEGTAGAVRAAIEHGLLNDLGARHKIYYIGPNFRYEKPQKGRYHIHHQFGAEAFGIASAEQDAECILLQMHFYARVGLKGTALRLNSLGDRTSKQRYRDMLREFLAPKLDHLSDDSRRRLDENPLRILDSKDPRDICACDGAPSALDSLLPESRTHFDRVCALLAEAGVKFDIDTKLVRGFDYYTGTLWEVTAEGLGAQSAVGGGGRYDNLVEQLGGRPTPAVGFGSGLERLLLALDAQHVKIPTDAAPLVWIAYHGEPARREAFRLGQSLRAAGHRVDLDLTGKSFKNQLALANKSGASLCIILGDTELQTDTVQLKNFATQSQATIPRSDLEKHL